MADKTNQNTRIDYWFKALKWFVLNGLFGIFPLLLMFFIKEITKDKLGHPQVDHLIYEGGLILFVLIAMMGAVLVDYLLSGLKSFGIYIFAIYIFPLLILGFVTTEFMLICAGFLPKETFTPTSITTIIVIIFSFVYCTLVKGNLYLREDTEKKKTL